MTDIPVLFDSREAEREMRRLAVAIEAAEFEMHPPRGGDGGRTGKPSSCPPPGNPLCAGAIRRAVNLMREASSQLEAVCRPKTTLDDMAAKRRDEQKQARREQRIKQEQTAKWAGRVG